MDDEYALSASRRPFGALEVCYSSTEIRVQGAQYGPALLVHRTKEDWWTVLLVPCCGQEWYVTESGADGCGRCAKPARPAESAHGWIWSVCSEVFATWSPLEQELLTETVIDTLGKSIEPAMAAELIDSRLPR